MNRTIERYSKSDRSKHWAVAIFFVLAALSGLSLFHPSLFFLSGLFGGGPWTRILHPFIGVLMFLGFVLMFFRFWRENMIRQVDREWARRAPHLMATGDEHSMPPVGKYNAGQKAVFWVSAISLVVLLLTGIVFWRPWFAYAFPITLIRIATLLHAFAAVVLILTIIVHIYAAIWVKGTIRAMTRGTVTEAWARQNHPLWHRDMTGRE